MGLFDAFRAVKVLSTAGKFVKQHEDYVNRITMLVEKVKGAIALFESKKKDIEAIITDAKMLVEKLKGLRG